MRSNARTNYAAAAHVQIAGCPDRHEPGTGELDAARALAQLDADGYNGYVGLEYKPRTTTQAGLGWTTPYLTRSYASR